MTSRITSLQVLRQERRPLVALASLAFVMRLCLLVLASALTPQTAAAAGLTSLCQPSAQDQTLPSSHDPLTCQCGPVCAHGCALGPCLAGEAPAPILVHGPPAAAVKTVGGLTVHAGSDLARPIRAPPLFLI